MNRDDFNIVSNYIYFDNAATTLKPRSLANVISEYYNNYTSNIHRGVYDLSVDATNKYESVRDIIKDFINAKLREEIIFTSGTTESINTIVFGYFKNHLKSGDEVILTKTEHASNVLPWFELSDMLDIKIKYIDLTDDYKVTLDNFKKVITTNTKVISIAHITNSIGDVRPIKEIIEYAHMNNILVLIDGAQSVGHISIDVQELDIDFLVFSAHKMCGPTGVGVLYGKYELLNETYPIMFGGDMNGNFVSDKTRSYEPLPNKLEAGTKNIAGVIGFGESIRYLKTIFNNIWIHEVELRDYAIKRLKEVKDIIIYNEFSESGIILFNISDIHSEDIARYLNKYNICVRSGEHCARMTKELIDRKATTRLSLYFYNTKEEIDKLIEVLKKFSIEDIIDL